MKFIIIFLFHHTLDHTLHKLHTPNNEEKRVKYNTPLSSRRNSFDVTSKFSWINNLTWMRTIYLEKIFENWVALQNNKISSLYEVRDPRSWILSSSTSYINQHCNKEHKTRHSFNFFRVASTPWMLNQDNKWVNN